MTDRTLFYNTDDEMKKVIKQSQDGHTAVLQQHIWYVRLDDRWWQMMTVYVCINQISDIYRFGLKSKRILGLLIKWFFWSKPSCCGVLRSQTFSPFYPWKYHQCSLPFRTFLLRKPSSWKLQVGTMTWTWRWPGSRPHGISCGDHVFSCIRNQEISNTSPTCSQQISNSIEQLSNWIQQLEGHKDPLLLCQV